MKNLNILWILCSLLSLSLALNFPDTPEGRAKKAKFEDYIDDAFSRLMPENPGKNCTIDTPSFGTNVTMTGFELDSLLFIQDAYQRPVLAFRGIKYADAERFQIPVAINNYENGTNIDATQIGPACPQSREEPENGIESEDCQYINVYTPHHPDNISDPLPVMVFIHGGSFTSGTGAYYLPMMYLRHEVIWVTINYRLGALGFFTINTDDAPGNYALYDQRESLRWVRDHIADFGGDNQSITVLGESAGSVSSSYMTIVADNDTIHKAVSESGTFSEVWSLDTDPEYAAHYIANKVGCNDNDTKEINMTCMLDADAWNLTAAEKDLVSEDRYNGLMGFRGAAPTIQAKNIMDAILTEWPQWYYENGQFNDVPYMMGTNKDEGSLITGIAEGDFLEQHCYNDTYCLIDDEVFLREAFVTGILGSFGVNDPSHGLTNSLMLQYCKGVDLGNYYDAAPCLIDMFGMLFLKAGGWKVANLHAHFGTTKTFHYSFDFDDLFELLTGSENYDAGVMHAEELKYLVSPLPYLNDTANAVSRRMTTMWTNFATYGDPTPDDVDNWQDLDIPQWTPYMFGDHHYMLMRAEFIMQKEFPLRWTVRYDEEIAGEPVTMEPPAVAAAEVEVASEVEPSTMGTKMADLRRKIADWLLGSTSRASESDVEEMEAKAEAYMITMIVFIVLFCIAVCAACYYYWQYRKKM